MLPFYQHVSALNPHVLKVKCSLVFSKKHPFGCLRTPLCQFIHRMIRMVFFDCFDFWISSASVLLFLAIYTLAHQHIYTYIFFSKRLNVAIRSGLCSVNSMPAQRQNDVACKNCLHQMTWHRSNQKTKTKPNSNSKTNTSKRQMAWSGPIKVPKSLLTICWHCCRKCASTWICSAVS